MVDSIQIWNHVTGLKLKAAQKYNISPQTCHIGHVILQGMLERPDGICQIDAAKDASETNLSVAVRSMRLASAMKNSGLQTGDSVVLMGFNHLDLCIPFYACHFNGYAMCAIDPAVPAFELQALFPYIKPKLVICQNSCVEKINESFKINNLEGDIITFDDKDNDLETFINQHKGTDINFRPAEFDHAKVIAWLMLTSGTTGTPKVAMIPFGTLLSSICNWWKPFVSKFEITLAMATLQWLSSLIFFVAGPMRSFTRLQSSDPITPTSIVGVINKYKPNVTAWSPYLLGQFLMAAEHGTCDLSSFKYIAIGGSSIEKKVLMKLKEKCPAYLYLAYGMTELMVPVFDFNDDTPENSTGYPCDRYQFRLVDDDGSIIDKPLTAGELWIKGDDFFKGYLNNPEETATILTDDGWFMTGDMFYKDEQDYYYFVERKKLIIKHFGFKIAPLQMEEVIKQHPGVQEVCVVGVPDPICQELPIAAILKKNGHNVDPEKIFALLRESLPDIKQLRGGLFFVDSFPETASGKIARKQVKEMAITAPKILPK